MVNKIYKTATEALGDLRQKGVIRDGITVMVGGFGLCGIPEHLIRAYMQRDPESAKECIDENRIVRRVAPEAIENTSGFFVLCPGDDPTYVDQWLKGCADAGIDTRAVPLGEAIRRERTLNPKLEAVYEVPDGTCDSTAS